jgi:putative MFS transporter
MGSRRYIHLEAVSNSVARHRLRIAVGGGRVVPIAAPTVIGWAITRYGLQPPFLALGGLWNLTVIGYLLGSETKGKELEMLADEALTEDLASV